MFETTNQYYCLPDCICVHSQEDSSTSYQPTGVESNHPANPQDVFLELTHGVFFQGLTFPFKDCWTRNTQIHRTGPLIFLHKSHALASLNVLPVGLAVNHQTSAISKQALFGGKRPQSPVEFLIFFVFIVSPHKNMAKDWSNHKSPKSNRGSAGNSYAGNALERSISPKLILSESSLWIDVDCVFVWYFFLAEKHDNYSQ